MSFPVISSPIYELVVPSTNKKIKFRPFQVRDQKSLLIAQQSEDLATMYHTLKDIIGACIISKDVNIDRLALFDVEYIFLQLRARSLGERVEVGFNCLECNDPNGRVIIPIDLTQMTVTFDPKHTSTIYLSDKIGVKMQYPDIEVLAKLKDSGISSEEEVDIIFNIIISSIESIFDEDSIYNASDHTKEEMIEFVNNLNAEQYDKIKDFFKTMPKLFKSIEFECPVCKFQHKQVIEGLDVFF